MTVDARLGRIGSEIDTTVIVGLFEEDQLDEGTPPIIDPALRRFIREALSAGDFKGKKQQLTVLYPMNAAPCHRVILAGLGSRDRFTLEISRQVSGLAIRKARELGATRPYTTVHGLDLHGFSPASCAQSVVEGCLLGVYDYGVYRTAEPETPPLEHLTVMFSQRTRANAVGQGVKQGRVVSEGVILARDLSNTPGNDLPPRALAAAAEKMAKQSGIGCRVLSRKEIEKEKMNALLAVNRGSAEPPRFIVLEYGEASEKHDTLVFVGKGVTFDSGGLSIKPAERMEDMKHDMSGAAAVIGAMKAIGEIKPDIHVVGLIPTTENLPDGNALRPGDVIRAITGKTIEIINTDAEGRLILADALGYAGRYRPAAVVDLATLTGACVVALGHAASGLMGNNEALIAKVRSAGDAVGERVWPLPIWEDYHDQIKSHIADVKNSGGRWGGALTAGAFLEKFVDYPWAHLDIAGTAYTDKDQPFSVRGATGVGVRLLVQLALDWTR